MYSIVEMSSTGEISVVLLEFIVLVINQSDCEKITWFDAMPQSLSDRRSAMLDCRDIRGT